MTLGQKVVFCGVFSVVLGQNVGFGWISCGAMIFFSACTVSGARLVAMSSLR